MSQVVCLRVREAPKKFDVRMIDPSGSTYYVDSEYVAMVGVSGDLLRLPNGVDLMEVSKYADMDEQQLRKEALDHIEDMKLYWMNGSTRVGDFKRTFTELKAIITIMEEDHGL